MYIAQIRIVAYFIRYMATHVLIPEFWTGSCLIMANDWLGILRIKKHSIISFFNEYINSEENETKGLAEGLMILKCIQLPVIYGIYASIQSVALTW